MNYTKIIDHTDLIKDNSSKAVINTDRDLFENIKKIRATNSSMKEIKTDIEILKNEILSIKNILKEITRHGS